ncbi:CPBP family intramembrane glutamic endopeptidase [Leifsonia poae]|uniref:CPBP family intramembrane glutamic endopeptidase n=1 Tax=Leifsonia poae TaxID=110933 RepID=UPI003D696AB3
MTRSTFFFDPPFTTSGVTASLAKTAKPVYGVLGFVIFITLTLVTIGVGLVAQPLVVSLLGAESPWVTSLTVFVTFLPLWVFFLIFTIRNRRHGSGLTSRGVGRFLLGVVVGIALVWMIMLTLVLFFGGRFTFNAQAFAAPAFWPVAVVSLLVFYVQGSGEEFMFRSMMARFLARRFSAVTIVIVTAAAFSAVHFSNGMKQPLVFLYTFVIGLLLGLLAVTSNSLWLVLGLHGVYNWATGYLTSIFLQAPADPAIAPLATSVAGGVAIVVVVIVLQVTKPGWHREKAAVAPERTPARADEPVVA